jgi:hypothetical protein
MKLWILIAVLMLGSTSSAFAAGGTDVVATKGQPAYVSEGWPEGAGELANDPVRTTGWNDWFSEWPNDVNQYALEAQSLEDVNRLIAKLAAVKSDLKEIRLCAMKEPSGFGWLTSVPKGNQIPVMFSIGDQTRLDQWYAHVRKPFGVMEFEACPIAVPPTLTLFVQNPIIDLQRLVIPMEIRVLEGYIPSGFHKSNTKQEREALERPVAGPAVKGETPPPEAWAAHDRIVAFLKKRQTAEVGTESESPAEGKTLIGTIVNCRYPDAEIDGDGRTSMSDGATMRGGGRTRVSTRLQTVMTTPDSFEKVVEFYVKKFGVTEDDTQRVDAPAGGQSVFSQDDSKDRPLSLRVISVNRDDTATTIVISRSPDEKLTHIAWSQYHWVPIEELPRSDQ